MLRAPGAASSTKTAQEEGRERRGEEGRKEPAREWKALLSWISFVL